MLSTFGSRKRCQAAPEGLMRASGRVSVDTGVKHVSTAIMGAFRDEPEAAEGAVMQDIPKQPSLRSQGG
jgi:hypothetical protein